MQVHGRLEGPVTCVGVTVAAVMDVDHTVKGNSDESLGSDKRYFVLSG